MAWDTPSEKDIEAYFVRQCKKRGWLADKFSSPNKRSVPDRIVFKPGGGVFFCELKAPGKEPTEKQAADHERRKNLGFRVYAADNFAIVDSVIKAEESR